jgi:hypothetical protein
MAGLVYLASKILAETVASSYCSNIFNLQKPFSRGLRISFRWLHLVGASLHLNDRTCLWFIIVKPQTSCTWRQSRDTMLRDMRINVMSWYILILLTLFHTPYCWKTKKYVIYIYYFSSCPAAEEKGLHVKRCPDKKENKFFLIFKEIQKGAIAKPYITFFNAVFHIQITVRYYETKQKFLLAVPKDFQKRSTLKSIIR